MLLLAIDWSQFYGGWDVGSVLSAAANGVAPLAPLVAVRIGYRWAFDLLRRLGEFLVR
jgi:hypothetical protein